MVRKKTIINIVRKKTIKGDKHMKDFIREIWHGQVQAEGHVGMNNREMKEILHLKNRNEEKLLAALSEEEKELYRKISDCETEYDALYCEEVFIEGVRFAVRMMAEALG